jgi:hypothetical protein
MEDGKPLTEKEQAENAMAELKQKQLERKLERERVVKEDSGFSIGSKTFQPR